MPPRKNKITNKDNGKRNNKAENAKRGNVNVDVPSASERARDMDNGRRTDSETFKL